MAADKFSPDLYPHWKYKNQQFNLLEAVQEFYQRLFAIWPLEGALTPRLTKPNGFKGGMIVGQNTWHCLENSPFLLWTKKKDGCRPAAVFM